MAEYIDREKAFQSTPPRGGRRRRCPGDAWVVDFNPRPREGGDYDVRRSFRITGISIHAPARGATVR